MTPRQNSGSTPGWRSLERGRWSRMPYVAAVAVALAVAAIPAPARGIDAPGPDFLDGCFLDAAAAAQAVDGMIVTCTFLRSAQWDAMEAEAMVADAMEADNTDGTDATDEVSSEFDATESVEPFTDAVNLSLPVAPVVGGKPGCVTGARRPVVDTSMPTLSVAFAVPSLLSEGVTIEYQSLDGGAAIFTSDSEPVTDRPVTLDFRPGELAPGESYRWRVRDARGGWTAPGWSAWCEFTVAADALDLRSLEDDDVDVVLELGLRPERRYTVSLTRRQWRVLLDAFDLELTARGAIAPSGDAPAEADERLRQIDTAIRRQLLDTTSPSAVTLTGGRWTTVVNQLAGSAGLADDAAAEVDPGEMADGSAYWELIDLVSTRLGGPPHAAKRFFR